MTFGSLFAGIGGMDLGLERAGMTCKWQVEIDPFARRVLEKHWPDVRRHDDVRTFPPGPAAEWGVDLICGGFPCQDISEAGRGGGINARRSGLWRQFARIIGALRPGIVLIENVRSLVKRGLAVVLSGLASLGFDAVWRTVSAADFGAPHVRRRVFLLAYRYGFGLHPAAAEDLLLGEGLPAQEGEQAKWIGRPVRDLGGKVWLAPVGGLHGMADGVPTRLERDRLRVLGNAVVPQVAEWIGRRLMEANP